MMDMVSSNELLELSYDEMSMIDGGVDFEAIGNGLAIASATLFAVACAPASAFVGTAFVATYVAGVLGGVAAGCHIGYGLAV